MRRNVAMFIRLCDLRNIRVRAERNSALLDSLFYLTLRIRAMRLCPLLVIVMLMSSVVAESAAQTLPVPQAITDPKKISSKPNAQVEPRRLTIEKLYMTRQIGRATWSPDGKSIAFVSNMSGRNNLWIVPSEGGFPVQMTVSDQRQTNAGVVARWKMDRVSVRLRRR